jgi:hypothetical protein
LPVSEQVVGAVLPLRIGRRHTIGQIHGVPHRCRVSFAHGARRRMYLCRSRFESSLTG